MRIIAFCLFFCCFAMVACRVPFKLPEEPSTRASHQVVIITGCSSGIGKSTALEFAKHRGFKVYATMRTITDWDAAPSENIVVAALDVTSDASVEALVARVMEAEGRIDIVVNNAGYGLAACLEMATIAEAKALFDTNVWGVVRVMQAALPHMRRAKQGYFITVTSTSGLRGVPCFEYYSGSKFALEGITDSMRYSLAELNISMTNLNAGPVVSAFLEGPLSKGTRAIDMAEPSAKYLQHAMERSLDNHEKRLSGAQQPADVALVVVNLVFLKKSTKRLTDVPFNIGSDFKSQRVVDAVRVHPDGWGGVYYNVMRSLPTMQQALAAEREGSHGHQSEL